MTSKMVFCDFPDIPSCLEKNPICMHSCPDTGCYDANMCKKTALTSLCFATYWHFTKRDITSYPLEWRDEEVVVCQQGNVCVLLGSEARQKRRRKMLTRHEIVNRLKFLRLDAEGWGASSLLEIKVSYAGLLLDICQGLGLSKEEYTSVLGAKALEDIITDSNKVYWVNPDLAANLAKEEGNKQC